MRISLFVKIPIYGLLVLKGLRRHLHVKRLDMNGPVYGDTNKMSCAQPLPLNEFSWTRSSGSGGDNNALTDGQKQ